MRINVELEGEMERLSVIHSCYSLGVECGGPPRSITQLCNPLSELNADVAIHVFKGEDEEVIPVPAVSILRSENGGVVNLRERVSASEVPTVIHQHGIWLPSAHKVTQLARELDLPLVLSPRGMMEPWAMANRRWKKLAAWYLYQHRDCRSVQAFHATSDMEAESIRRLGLKQPIIVLPNGVLPAPAEPLDPNACQKGREKKTALFLSRINPKKGLPLLLQAWADLMPTNWELVIAGNDDENHLPELEAMVVSLGLQNCVKFTGPLFDVDKDTAYRRADIFILPTYSENFGIVVAEALSYEVPVITTTGTPWAELKEHNCGWWVEPTVVGITGALDAALNSSPDVLLSMGERGNSLVRDRYAWTQIAENMQLAYQWLLGRAPKPSFVVE
jgi:glycosyltransferase involved in cell wall biosynthesis